MLGATGTVGFLVLSFRPSGCAGDMGPERRPGARRGTRPERDAGEDRVGEDLAAESSGGSRVTCAAPGRLCVPGGRSLKFPRPFTSGSSHQDRSERPSPSAALSRFCPGSVPAVGLPSTIRLSEHPPGLVPAQSAPVNAQTGERRTVHSCCWSPEDKRHLDGDIPWSSIPAPCGAEGSVLGDPLSAPAPGSQRLLCDRN